jgi:hypothetical protein
LFGVRPYAAFGTYSRLMNATAFAKSLADCFEAVVPAGFRVRADKAMLKSNVKASRIFS